MRAKKSPSSKQNIPSEPIELCDDELETVWGGGPHVRVLDGVAGR